jgi:hypothetical protein
MKKSFHGITAAALVAAAACAHAQVTVDVQAPVRALHAGAPGGAAPHRQ